jgi:hypothetical protein
MRLMLSNAACGDPSGVGAVGADGETEHMTLRFVAARCNVPLKS